MTTSMASPEPPPGKAYLGVFISIVNEGDEAAEAAEQLHTIDDTRDTAYELALIQPYTPRAGVVRLPAGSELPAPDNQSPPTARSEARWCCSWSMRA